MTKGAPSYAVPALDKALDVVELLAERAPLTQREIASATGWTASQLFRVLTVLERRGYLLRDAAGAYDLSPMLVRLGLQREPIGALVRLAEPLMRRLAEDTGQSCNLGVLDDGAVLIVAQATSPAPFGFQVRVGARFPIESATGRALTAGGTGIVEQVDSRHSGVTDLVVPIVDRVGTVLAALTVPYVDTSVSRIDLDAVRSATAQTAATVSGMLGGMQESA